MADPITSIPSTTATGQLTGGASAGGDAAGGGFNSINYTPPVVSTLGTSNIAPTSPITVTNPPTPTNGAGAVNGGAALIAGNNGAITPPLDTTSTDPNSILESLKALLPPPPSSADTYNTDYNESGIAGDQSTANVDQQAVLDAQGNLTGINNQLNALNAESTGADLQLTNSAGGQAPSFLISGQQAQSDRNYAIRAIPLQAQALGAQAAVAAAQGKASLSQQILTQAQNQLDKVFQIQTTDANNAYTYQTNLIDKAIDVATTAQANQLAAQKAQLSTNHSDLTNAVNNAQSAAASATANGNGQLAAQIAQIPPPDINSPTFAADLQAYNAKIGALQAQNTPKASAETTSVVNVNGRQLLIDTKTGQTIKDLGASSSSSTANDQTITSTVNNIVDGQTKFSDIDSSDSNYQNIKAQLSTLGFFSSTPPAWYVQAQNDKFQGDLLPSAIQTSWTAYVKQTLGT